MYMYMYIYIGLARDIEGFRVQSLGLRAWDLRLEVILVRCLGHSIEARNGGSDPCRRPHMSYCQYLGYRGTHKGGHKTLISIVPNIVPNKSPSPLITWEILVIYSLTGTQSINYRSNYEWSPWNPPIKYSSLFHPSIRRVRVFGIRDK